jgi:hypothetical protein
MSSLRGERSLRGRLPRRFRDQRRLPDQNGELSGKHGSRSCEQLRLGSREPDGMPVRLIASLHRGRPRGGRFPRARSGWARYASRAIAGVIVVGTACQPARAGPHTAGGAESTDGDTEMNDVTLLPNQEIRVVFPLRGIRLVPGVDGSGGLPMEAHTALYAVDDRDAPAPIRRPEDLAPFVAGVNTAEQAEDFVRLFTGPATHYLFQRGDFIVDATVLSPGDPPVLGGVAADVAATAGARPPLVTADGEALLLERDVLHFPSDPPGTGGLDTAARARRQGWHLSFAG